MHRPRGRPALFGGRPHCPPPHTHILLFPQGLAWKCCVLLLTVPWATGSAARGQREQERRSVTIKPFFSSALPSTSLPCSQQHLSSLAHAPRRISSYSRIVHRQVNGCERGARDRNFCAAHGGGRRCSVEGCGKAAVRQLLCPFLLPPKNTRAQNRCSFLLLPVKISLSIRPNAQPPPLCRLEKLASARPTVEESAALQKVRLRLRCWSQQPRGVAAAHGRASVVVACVTPPRLRVHAAGCTKSAQSSTQFCVRHGGGRKCMVEGCSKVGKRRTARSLSPRPRRTEFEVCALNMCAMLVFWCVRWTGMFGVGWRALVFQVSRGTTKLCASHAKTPRCACGHIAVSRIALCSTCTLLLLLSQLRRTPHSLATSPKACLNCCGCCLASD